MKCASVQTVLKVQEEKLRQVMKGSENCGGSPTGDRSDLCQEYSSSGTVEAFLDLAALTDNLKASWGEAVLYSAYSTRMLWLSGLSSAPIWAPEL